MHKFFVPKQNIDGDNAIIDGEDVKHIYKVLRLKIGDVVSVNNCEGSEYVGEITLIDKKSVTINLLEKSSINNESPIEVYLFQGMPKSTKMDLIVQKNTELGVKAITPMISQRVVVKTELCEFKKVDRWNRIALEACKQCKRSLVPEINVPIEFDHLLEELKHMDLVVVPYENEEGYGIKKLMKDIEKNTIVKVGIVIGPEGGFEESEIQKLTEIGAKIVTLGPRILRTETAGFTCLSLIMYELGDLGGVIE
ncbi:16S rRNA (uracil(1498)-N(3))-methyltransferase [Clostridium tagluense]|uniref:Ribosomal RNA small subunit methyltransferase E n=1 Tax=Clostridium tagluense TaxID=360422 RepID=A0A401UHS4_9CLOT|nr:16S rRNA (uracil(1498)-N(3))-methyltransferase [Clostridium tagluense]MBU3128452.1 16S rRNA (uracil(1498)-N(3))-methyltransferase [Clostridium tagluense]MBW9155042.1 16S rRNA (uracil(1498)-N(3))-methyltransferase [Clostridium tagluense]MCB2297268.1 16S rRNA (uracil(1498)-N(3))-methyltransferase [Clostridium tagluense]MCB2310110.1 16S rRNA (uracil(1498)-N(3))-methyltransferase [Clostridium tagluense]MCB2314360.1 16S rRNA (uracil(1498)-N(3))-methyltransferase [Clostridium tagluense]